MAQKGIPSAGTEAVRLIANIRLASNNERRNALCDQLTALLVDTDFREWKPDPTKCPAKKGKSTPVKKAAKRVRR